MKEFYKSDVVDNTGKAHESIGENIRCKDNVVAVLTGKTNPPITSEEINEIKTLLGIATSKSTK